MAEQVAFCGPCLREQTELPAVIHCLECSENLCENCKNFHRKMKSLSSHSLYEIDEKVPSTDKLDLLNFLMKCPDHEAEDVRFICKDHDQLCCNDCAIVKHRKCDHLISLLDEQFTKSTTGNDTRNRLERIKHDSEKLVEFEKEREKSANATVAQVEEKLIEVKTLLDKAFMELKQAITSEVAEKREGILEQSKMHTERMKKFTGEVDLSLDKLDYVSKNGEKVHMFLVERMLELELRRHEDMLQTLRQGSNLRTIKVVDNVTDSEIVKTITSCFHIEEETPENQALLCTPGNRKCKDIEPALVYTGKVMSSKCNVCSSIWFGDYLVVVLNEVKQIKLFTVEYEAISHITTRKTTFQPWAVTEIDSKRFGVCFPIAKEIEIMEIYDGKFETKKIISTDTDIWDISVDQLRREMVCLSRSGSIDIYKLDGSKVRSLPLTPEMVKAVKNAYSICCDNNRELIYICSHELNKLLAIRFNGTTVFEYSSPKLKYPWHPDIDRDGNIYVPFYSLNGGMGAVHQIDSTGKLLREINLPGHGLCVSFDRTKTKFLLSCSKSEHLVLMYHLT